jgi:hypothetical protein
MNEKETRNNIKAIIRRKASCCEGIMMKRNAKTNDNTGNEQKEKYCFDGKCVRGRRNGPLEIRPTHHYG